MAEKDVTDGLRWPLTSTHCQNWLLPSMDKLKEIQASTYEKALSRVKERVAGASVQYPTLEDEIWLIKYYSFQLHRFLMLHNIKTYVKEAALTYFNRFYLKRSLLEYDPRIIMFTCVTLAIKLEDMWRAFTVDRILGSVENLDIDQVFDMEPIVCDALGFNFGVLHTTDVLHFLRKTCYEVFELLPFLKDSQHLKDSLGLDDETLSEHISLILSVIKNAENDSVKMQENAQFLFLYTPAQLAVANFIHYCKSNLDAIISLQGFVTAKLLNGDATKVKAVFDLLDNARLQFKAYCKERTLFDTSQSQAGSLLDKYLAIYKLKG